MAARTAGRRTEAGTARARVQLAGAAGGRHRRITEADECPVRGSLPAEAFAGLETSLSTSLDAGATLRDLQDALGHAEPRTTRRYDRSRGQLDRSPGYTLTTYLATGG